MYSKTKKSVSYLMEISIKRGVSYQLKMWAKGTECRAYIKNNEEHVGYYDALAQVFVPHKKGDSRHWDALKAFKSEIDTFAGVSEPCKGCEVVVGSSSYTLFNKGDYAIVSKDGLSVGNLSRNGEFHANSHKGANTFVRLTTVDFKNIASRIWKRRRRVFVLLGEYE